MTKSELFQHLLEGSGPFDPDSIDTVETTPELVAMLRETLTSTPVRGVDSESVIRNGLPISAAFLLGLFGSLEDVPLLMAALRQAIVDGREWMNDAVPLALAALGPGAFPAIIARIDELESAPPDEAADTELVLLSMAASRLADASPDALETFVRFVAPRISDPANDARVRSNGIGELRWAISSMWVDAAFELVDPRLESAILGYFDRVGDDAQLDPGDRDDYLGRPRRRERIDPRVMLTHRFLDYDRYLRRLAERNRRDKKSGSITSRVTPEARHEYLRQFAANAEAAPLPATVTRAATKIGRNDPCPCGSGRKYKKCCGKE